MTVELTFPADAVTTRAFEHPNGETGIISAVRATGNEFADHFDLDGNRGDGIIVVPFKHKADGATNFSDYRTDGETTTLVYTDEQYAQVRERLDEML